MPARSVVLIAHNLRSAHNVGSLLRSADGLGIEHMYLTGYSPHPAAANDSRLPHIAAKVSKRIAKTSLGAENSVIWSYERDIVSLLSRLKKEGYVVAALEQTPDATPLHSFSVPLKLVLIVGREVAGIEPEILDLCDRHLHIPMHGQKESFNVAVAGAMAMHLIKLKSDGQM